MGNLTGDVTETGVIMALATYAQERQHYVHTIMHTPQHGTRRKILKIIKYEI